MSRSESTSVPTEQESDDAQPDENDTRTYPTHGDGFWSDDKFRDAGRYDY